MRAALGVAAIVREPRRFTLRGYDGDTMEPFVARDGRFLLFNNRNDPRINTDLHFASRVDDLTFDYRGEVKGVNTPALEGVPSMDDAGNLYFISTRSYRETLSTLYRGNTLWAVDGEFSGGPHPRSADIAIAVRDGSGFRRLPASAELLKNVNTGALEYAPAVSRDALELFFTRIEGAAPAIYRAGRQSDQEPLSADGRALYYHKLEDGRFVIHRVAR